jgi:hypothetical protein
MPGRHPVAVDQLELVRLTTPAGIRGVLHLRENIDLSMHAAADGEFRALEKKEMSWALFLPSTCAVTGSARSASSRWAMA